MRWFGRTTKLGRVPNYSPKATEMTKSLFLKFPLAPASGARGETKENTWPVCGWP